jgi:hypothetical protein
MKKRYYAYLRETNELLCTATTLEKLAERLNISYRSTCYIHNQIGVTYDNKYKIISLPIDTF